MKLGPDITRIAALLGEPARANMLSALMGGQAWTAGELAREAGVTPQTASSHLAQLEAGGLIRRRCEGRHNYFALAGQDVAEVMEQLALLAGRAGHMRTRPGPRDPAMRRARVCYNHLAGDAGVAMLDALIAQRRIADVDGSLIITDEAAPSPATSASAWKPPASARYARPAWTGACAAATSPAPSGSASWTAYTPWAGRAAWTGPASWPSAHRASTPSNRPSAGWARPPRARSAKVEAGFAPKRALNQRDRACSSGSDDSI